MRLQDIPCNNIALLPCTRTNRAAPTWPLLLVGFDDGEVIKRDTNLAGTQRQLLPAVQVVLLSYVTNPRALDNGLLV